MVLDDDIQGEENEEVLNRTILLACTANGSAERSAYALDAIS